jgi:hypothetical protein
MKRKIYTTARERRIDQLIGFVARPLINAALAIAAFSLQALIGTVASRVPYFESVPLYSMICILQLPWIVNGVVIIMAFFFRPYVGIGYPAFISVIVCAETVLGILLQYACFGIILLAWLFALLKSLLAQPLSALPPATLCSSGIVFLALVTSW